MKEESLETFPRLLLHHAAAHGARPAIREKDLGIWQTWTWGQVAAEVRDLANGLALLGFRRGDSLAIVGDNRPRLYWALCAAQALGGIPVPIYQDAVAAEMIYVLRDAEAAFVLAEDQEQVDKLLEALPQCPRIRHIVYDDTRGMRHYAAPQLCRYDALIARARNAPGAIDFEAEAGKARGDDVAIMLYTSGTTGEPKGVRLSHDNLLVTARNAARFDGLTERDEILSYLPMAWVGDNVFSYAQAYVTGFCVNCPESSQTVLTDMREIGPTYYFAPPRVFESLLTQVMIRMEDAAAPKRALFRHFMALARRVGPAILDGGCVSLLDRLHYALGELLVYGPLKNVLGMSRIRVGYTAGEAIGPDIFIFFRSLGINLKQLYGQTEGAVFVCMQPTSEVRPDTVGPPAPGVEVKVTAAGEVMYRGPGVFAAYHNNPTATAQTKTADGWVRTGDAGYFDAAGHLRIVDRAHDVGKLADGTLFAPKFIENKLKFFPHIKEAVAFGDGRAFCAVFVNIDLESVGNWAERRNLAYAGYTDLAAKEAVYALVADCVAHVNADLAADPKLAGSQIRRFLILPKELDADDGELTRTRKVRRGRIAERYASLVHALYSGEGRYQLETRVQFEDGRTGMIRAEVRIADLPARQERVAA
ncbi:MAG: AMP-binding protein [Betaproteobacteria bacterium]|nr:AMP-binding protein [Betaproteobacteria bacterium]